MAFIKPCVPAGDGERLDSDRLGNEALGRRWDGTGDVSGVYSIAVWPQSRRAPIETVSRAQRKLRDRHIYAKRYINFGPARL